MGGQSHRTDLGPRSSSLTRTPGISHSVECNSPEPSLLAACTSSHCCLLGAGSPGCPAQLLAQEGLIFFFMCFIYLRRHLLLDTGAVCREKITWLFLSFLSRLYSTREGDTATKIATRAVPDSARVFMISSTPACYRAW